MGATRRLLANGLANGLAIGLAAGLGACQGAAPPEPEAGNVTQAGDWTVRTSATVRVDAGVVH
ncbi:hypothetical protein [Afifella pfennigii]|uniref:hypothetical protein n=1 Tax=Afifella pfennigii TaxID=209897 RepID=UPI00047B9299|nr:hypothetical protein [Afifella pfennigii]